ncbi:MUC2 protein, partial [Baryphthengus martii]|nr:MUC2 protein [Baryphthengus martii]
RAPPTSVVSVLDVSNCSSSSCLPDCTCIWTDWIDVSYPDSSDKNSGDYETFENILNVIPNWECAHVENISCRASKFPDTPLDHLGQIVECSVDSGLICNNKDQPIGGIIPMPVCLNYEISVCCTPNKPECLTSTTTSTTTLSTSTMSTVSSPPETTTTPTPTPSQPPSTTTTTMPPPSTTTTTMPPPSTPTATMPPS